MPSESVASPRALGVTLTGLGREFSDRGTARTVLGGIDLEIRAGEILAALGPSGCGKSTLLRLVAGLDTPDTGRVTIDGTPVSVHDQRVGIGFQEPRLLPWRSVAANVAYGLPLDTSSPQRRARVAELLELVRLSEAARLRPRQVSGGMAQRVSLARALARQPGVLVLDEPFGALDALTRITMQDLLLDAHAAEPTTVLLVTHDVDEAIVLADRILVLGADPARPDAGAGIRLLVDAPGERPRDRADPAVGELRARLLVELGIESHHPSAATAPRRA